MKRIDFIAITFLIMAVVIIFFPIFFSDYLYIDEATQLLSCKKGINF